MDQKPFVVLISEDIDLGKKLFKEYASQSGAGLSYINLVTERSRNEFVKEIERYLETGEGQFIRDLEPGQIKLVADLEELLAEAKAGEFDDFSNVKYAAPKMALASKLYEMRERVIRGIYD